jgi:hypothetical protein
MSEEEIFTYKKHLMMTQIKIFEDMKLEKLSQDVNKWLEVNFDKNIIDIKLDKVGHQTTIMIIFKNK